MQPTLPILFISAKDKLEEVVEVLIVGKKINRIYLDEIQPKIEKKIKRKINFMVSSTGTSQPGLVVFEI